MALGGITENYVTRVGDLKLGSLIVKNPVTGYSKDLTRGGDAGTIGGEIFRRFKVIFDYSRGRMILEKNSQFSEPYKYDASGLFLAAEGANFESVKVLRVVEHTPAAMVGLREGDVILRIDNKEAKTFSLEQLRRIFMQQGRTYHLAVKRNRSVIKTKITLRALI